MRQEQGRYASRGSLLEKPKMDIITNINAAITTLKSAKDIAQALLDGKTGMEVQNIAIELQSKILAAQGSAIETQAQIFELQRELAAKETELQQIHIWQTEQA